MRNSATPFAMFLWLLLLACQATEGAEQGDSGIDAAVADDDSGNTAGGADTAVEECEPHHAGSCVEADRCTQFDGPYFTQSNLGELCPQGELAVGCSCPTEGATGICHTFSELQNEYATYFYDDAAEDHLLECLHPLNTWESTALSPDLSLVCDALSRSQNTRNGVVSECSKRWFCGPEIQELGLTCVRNTSGAEPTYDCSCDEDGVSVSMFSDADVCGTTTGADGELEALMIAAATAGCGWTVPSP